MLYSVVQHTKYIHSDGTRYIDKEILCTFADKKDAKKYIDDQFYIMLGLGYRSVAINSGVYEKTYEITERDTFTSIEHTVKVQEIVNFVVSETWDSGPSDI